MTGDQKTIEKIGIEDARRGRRGKCQREYDIRTFRRGPSEQIIKIGWAVVDVRKNVIHCIGIVVICHKASSQTCGQAGILSVIYASGQEEFAWKNYSVGVILPTREIAR